jgi:hypothetical protein
MGAIKQIDGEINNKIDEDYKKMIRKNFPAPGGKIKKG